MKRSILVSAAGVAFALRPSVTQAETIDALGVPGEFAALGVLPIAD